MKTLIMGILNYTPDSFSDGGLYNTPDLAAERAVEIESLGADIIDIGCNSTRPGADILSGDEELKRLVPALRSVIGKVSIPVSVDTFYPECAAEAFRQGAEIINDVSGEFNPEIAALAVKHSGKYIVTHNPGGADFTAEYPRGVTASVREFFEGCVIKAEKCGLDRSSLILDPGFGFGKSESDNYELLSNLSLVKIEGYALLAALSRKRFIRSCPPARSDWATSAANALAIINGADMIRVHNVEAAVQSAAVADKIRKGRENG